MWWDTSNTVRRLNHLDFSTKLRDKVKPSTLLLTKQHSGWPTSFICAQSFLFRQTVNANTNMRLGEAFTRHSSFSQCHKLLGRRCIRGMARALHAGPEAGNRSMAVIREGNYTHNLFNGPQVQQRCEAHKDPDQGGLLLHCREQEVQEHISESFPSVHFFFLFLINVTILFV